MEVIDVETEVVVKKVSRYDPTVVSLEGHDMSVGDVGSYSLGGER